MKESIFGVVPVLSTPLTQDEEIDVNTLNREVDWVASHGVCAVATGMVSEILRMSIQERKILTETLCVSAIQNNILAIPSCGTETIKETIQLALHAESWGASAVMINPPISTSLSDAGFQQFFSEVFRAISIPIIVQDASGYVGKPIGLDTLHALFDQFESRIYFKPEAVPIGQRLSNLRDITNGKARIFEGTGGANVVDSYSRGIIGTMPGADLVWASVALWKALEQDNWPLINKIGGAIAALVNLMPNLDAYIAIEKHLLMKQRVFLGITKKQPTGFILDQETRDEAERIFDYLRELV
jgi:dihydrodipicolinate synthase/N-acetylneuraminate lyase